MKGPDFKGSLPSSCNRFVFVVIDERFCFLFTFAFPDMSSQTVIKCLSQPFVIFDMPLYVNSDRRSCLISTELKNLTWPRNFNLPYHSTLLQGNGRQYETYNGILFRTITLSLLINDYSTILTDPWVAVLFQHVIHSKYDYYGGGRTYRSVFRLQNGEETTASLCWSCAKISSWNTSVTIPPRPPEYVNFFEPFRSWPVIN